MVERVSFDRVISAAFVHSNQEVGGGVDGIGPITVAVLFQNLLELKVRQ